MVKATVISRKDPGAVFREVGKLVGGDVTDRRVVEGLACYDAAGGHEVVPDGRGFCHEAASALRKVLKDAVAPVWAYRLTEDVRDVVWVAYATAGTGNLQADDEGKYRAAYLKGVAV